MGTEFERTYYETAEEAAADGWVSRMHVPTDWTIKDTSGPNQFGYEFTATSPDGRTAVTRLLTIGGRHVLRYRESEFYSNEEGHEAEA